MKTDTDPVTGQPLARSLRITAIAIVIGLLLVPSLALAQISSGRPPTLLSADITSVFAVRPATISFGASADVLIGGPGITQSQFKAGDYGHISWSRWTSASAVGRGLIWSNDCNPNCPEGTYHSSQVAIRAGDGNSGRFRWLSYTYRTEGHRLHIHSTLRRMPGTTDAWEWG
jgi:hypothetical protein